MSHRFCFEVGRAMRRGRYGLLGMLVVSAGAPAIAAGSLPADLARAAAEYDRSQIEGSREALERLLAPDYQLVNGSGTVESREQFIAESADIRLEPFTVEHAVETVWSCGAVLGGEVHISGTDHGKAFMGHFRFADVWRKEKGIWHVVFTEVTRLAASGS
ncbi:MAG TPA: nuclear transport factor 2 family protein [Steroidobacteraceae bacterium]|jgi:hypothetical protein